MTQASSRREAHVCHLSDIIHAQTTNDILAQCCPCISHSLLITRDSSLCQNGEESSYRANLPAHTGLNNTILTLPTIVILAQVEIRKALITCDIRRQPCEEKRLVQGPGILIFKIVLGAVIEKTAHPYFLIDGNSTHGYTDVQHGAAWPDATICHWSDSWKPQTALY